MSDADGVSLLDESRHELTGGFHPLLLWRDRQRILAQPEIAAQPRPPLANAPLRFALALSLTPMLLVAWLVSFAVGLLPGERPERFGLEYRSDAVIEALAPHLPGVDRARLDALAHSMRRRAMAPEAARLAAEAQSLIFFRTMMPAAERQAELETWAGKLRASSVPRSQQDVLLAQMLDAAHDMRRGDQVFGEITRSVSEGGPLMQFLSVVSMLASAWLFGQMLRGDARYPNAARSDGFYLYYSTSRVFWFLPAQALAYGLVSYGSATGSAALMYWGQGVMMTIALASVAYLLAGSRRMASALAGGQTPRGGAWSIGWRMVVAMSVSSLLMMFAFAIVGAVVGFASAAWG
jgi:hypothetical protein